jgi:hypothetical protein
MTLDSETSTENLTDFHRVEERAARPTRIDIAPGRLLVNGRRVDAKAAETMQVTDPPGTNTTSTPFGVDDVRAMAVKRGPKCWRRTRSTRPSGPTSADSFFKS